MFEDWKLNKIFQCVIEKGASFADLFGEDAEVKSVCLEDNKIEKMIGGRYIGIGLRGIKDLRTIYSYTSDTREKAVLALSREMAGVMDGRSGFSPRTWQFPSVPNRLGSIKKTHGVSTEKEIELSRLANEVARNVDPSVQQVKVVYRSKIQRISTANTMGEATSEERVSTVFLVDVVARKGDIIQTAYEQIAEAKGLEILSEEKVKAVTSKAAQRAVDLLDARPAPSGPLTVVVSSSAGGTMIHEAVGHGLEADLSQQGLSVYSGKMNQQVASPEISVIDDATIGGARGSFIYDDEGVPAQRTILVDKGVLRSYMYDRLTAMKEGVPSTGNGRRESYGFCPIPRMTNTLIVSGETDPHKIISSVNTGLLVVKMGGGEVDTVNGNFVFDVSEGYLLERGRIGDMVRGATLIGNGPKVLKEIDMVGSDLGFGVGTCGKDAQGVPVSDAQPTLRIPQIVVGGTEG